MCSWREVSKRDNIYLYIYIHVEAQNPIIKRYNGVGGELHSHHPSQDSGEMVLWGRKISSTYFPAALIPVALITIALILAALTRQHLTKILQESSHLTLCCKLVKSLGGIDTTRIHHLCLVKSVNSMLQQASSSVYVNNRLHTLHPSTDQNPELSLVVCMHVNAAMILAATGG